MSRRTPAPPPAAPAVTNAEVAAVFDEIADLLEVEDANPFRIRAYRNAARTVSGLGRPLAELIAQGADLDTLPGIGADLAGKIAEIVATGTCALLERLRGELPPGITALLKVPGLGPKRVRALHHELGVHTVDDLAAAARAGRIRAIPGFGPKTEQAILQAVTAPAAAHAAADAGRVSIALAEPVAEALVAALAAVPGVERVVPAGSLRRRRDTVGDLDLLVTVRGLSGVMERFTTLPQVRQVLAKGRTRASVVLASGLQVDLRVVPAAEFGAALVYFTGSKAHNIALRRLAQARGLKINEYGVFRGEERLAGDTEASVYAAVGLPFIAPELREDRGEIEAAQAARLPKLVEPADLRGDLHVHTTDSDGRDTLEAMAAAARARGFEYLAITDHSARLAVAHGLDAKRLEAQIGRIDRLNERLRAQKARLVLLKGIEVDILADGRLDLPDEILQRLDLVVGALHSRLNLPREKQTDRVLRAMDARCFTILAHPTARLLGERGPVELDLPRVLRHAKQRGCFVELNAQPQRLDLDDAACRLAKDEGVLVAIDSDAHATADFDALRHGVGQARRGWLEATDVLNTRPLSQLRPLLARTMR
ncbi:DNA polymerase/3'-5' exonuclease PolX [Azohydromonas sediminis]|uniref:DNA polymerase/3'-5' exonuclease PolX n=1 Tax=Azohydromonas sediminis TaxID=2259674 RepID=UPI001F1EC544|nr:DNA polymerase/3'-5' exonuclease PolX [Azohydromonas sediminis]